MNGQKRQQRVHALIRRPICCTVEERKNGNAQVHLRPPKVGGRRSDNGESVRQRCESNSQGFCAACGAHVTLISQPPQRVTCACHRLDRVRQLQAGRRSSNCTPTKTHPRGRREQPQRSSPSAWQVAGRG